MRELNIGDVEGLTRIIQSSGISDALGNLRVGVSPGEVAFTILEAADFSQIIDWLAGIYETTPDEFRKLPLNKLADTLEAVFTSEGGRDFFERLKSIFPKPATS